MPDISDLRQRQSLPMEAKILMSQHRIREWYEHWEGKVYVSFSGGKDSTVLAYLVHDIYPDVPLVYMNTGLEYPEVQAFCKKMGAEFLRPKMSFSEVISTYGYPIISKENSEAIYYARRIRNGAGAYATAYRKREELHGTRADPVISRKKEGEETKKEESDNPWRRRCLTGEAGSVDVTKSIYNKQKWLPLCRETQFMISHECCSIMKKGPFGIYQRKNKVLPIVGSLAEESRLRRQAWIRHGCNVFEGRKRTSQPISFWTEQDVLQCIKKKRLEYCSIYGDIVTVDEKGNICEEGCEGCKYQCTGANRTGCIFCGFGAHLEKKGETRFQRLAKTHPKQYEYCMGGGQWVDNPNHDPTAPKMDGEWENWNPKKIWVPSKEGLGMKKVFDDCNDLYGKNFIRYD